MMNPIVVLERVTRVAPLGVRFWDSVTGTAVGERLIVTAYPRGNPNHCVQAVANRFGVYSFANMPGLREFEFGAGDTAFWASHPPQFDYVVQVSDSESRFLPFSFLVQVPVRGLYNLDCAPPTSPPMISQAGIPLFSSPARSVPGGMAAIRAQLRDFVYNVPAAWAMLEAEIEGQPPVRGMADKEGRVALISEYPEPPHFSTASPPASPPSGARRPLTQQTWSVRIRAFYSPVLPAPEIPDLCQVLNQSETNIYLNPSPATFLTEVSLEFGKELVLKSESQSVLFINPTGSPPI